MNPLFQAVISAAFFLKRTCPKCRRVLVVPAIKRRESLRCGFCRADVPPRKKH